MPAPPFPVPLAAVRATLALRRRVLGLADRLLPADGAVLGLMEDAGLRPGRVRHSGLQMLVEGVRAGDPA